MVMRIVTMVVCETTPELTKAHEKLGWNTWPNGTVVSRDVSSYPNNGGWKCLSDFQKSRMRALKNHPTERAEIITNGIRVTGSKQYSLRTVQEITIEN